MKLTMCRGLPGSGKSTWAASQITDSVVEVNRDNIRVLLGFDNTKGFNTAQETYVRVLRDGQIAEALRAGKSVISSDLNIHPRNERELRRTAEFFGAEFEIKDFPTSVEECVRRDAKRPHPVGERVIRDWDSMWRR
jgi:predicted kinase